MSDAAMIAIVTAAASVLTTILVNLFQERRVNQKFDLQMKAEAAREKRQLMAAEIVAAELKRETQTNREALKAHAAAMQQELAKNTELTGMAYNAANNFELKLERLAKVFDSVHTDREVQRQMMQLTADTNQVVHEELQPDVAAIKRELVPQDDDGSSDNA